MISREQLERLIAEEVTLLSEDDRARFGRDRIEPQKQKCVRATDGVEEPIYMVARRGQSFILFDDVEEEFGVGTSDPDGTLRRWSLYDSLRTCIRCFPEEKYVPSENTSMRCSEPGPRALVAIERPRGPGR